MPSHATRGHCALRAPTFLSVRIKTIRTEKTVTEQNKDSAGFFTRSPIAYGRFFFRAQSAIRADGFSSAQQRNSATTWHRDAHYFIFASFSSALPVTRTSFHSCMMVAPSVS
jgi:hypothetical protein